jgi:hypothetical protein
MGHVCGVDGLRELLAYPRLSLCSRKVIFSFFLLLSVPHEITFIYFQSM